MNLGQIPCIRASIFTLRELNKAERDGLINRCERPSAGEVGLNSGRNEDQTFSPGLWHKPGLMVMGQGRGALVPVRALNRDQWPTWPGRPSGLTNRDQFPHWSRF